MKVGKRACDCAAHAAHRGGFCVELDFPVGAVEECVSGEVPPMPDTLNGVSVINICKTSTIGNLMVVRRNLFFCFQQSLLLINNYLLVLARDFFFSVNKHCSDWTFII